MLNALLLATCATLGQLSLIGKTYTVDGLRNPSVSGNYAFYANRDAGLLVFDVSDPTNPTPVGSYLTSGLAADTGLDGNMLYVATTNGLLILDVSTPSVPTLVGSLSTPLQAVVVEGAYVYTGTLTGGDVQVLDVSNPAFPSLMAVSKVGNTVSSLSLSGNYLYVGAGSGGVVAMSVVDKASPVVVATIAGVPGWALAVSGTTLYAAGSNVYQVDITDPAASFVLGSQVVAGLCFGLFVEGGRLYVSVHTHSTLIVMDEMTHVELGRVDGRAHLGFVVGGVMYTGTSSCVLLDVSNPASITTIGSWQAVSRATRQVTVSADGATAFVASSLYGMLIFDVSQPTPVLTVAIPVPGDYETFGHAMCGTTIYHAHDTGVTVIDVSTPASPTTVTIINTVVDSLHLEGTKLYALTNGNGRVVIYDVTNPTPAQVGDIFSGVNTYSLGVVGDYIYMGTEGAVLIYDATNIASPSLVPYTLTGLPAASSSWMLSLVHESGQYAYMAFNAGGLVVLDVTNPAAPTVATVFDASGVNNVALGEGNRAYLTLGSGLAVVDITNPLSPSLMSSSYDTYGEAVGVCAHGDRVYVADRGLLIFDAGFFEIGCFKTNVQFLTYAYEGTDTTPAKCQNWCKEKGHTYAGVEYGAQCWCGDSASGAVKTAGGKCEAKACTGDASDHCGGSHHMRLFKQGPPPSQPTPEMVGCFSTDESPRKLDVLAFTSGKTTVEECTSVCERNGYKYAGLEFGDECWCGNTLPVERVGRGKCSRPCTGDASQMCGNGYRASVYVVDGSSVAAVGKIYEGCFADSASPRTLPVRAFKDNTWCTVDECVAVCAHNGYAVAGLQVRNECWCGPTIPVDAPLSEGGCRMSCSGNNAEMCGYAWRNSVYSVVSM